MVPRKSHNSDSMSRKYDYVLQVRPADHPPFEASVTLYAAYLGAKPHEYDEVRVKYDPKSLKVIFDFAGDERFDTDAMNARTARLRKETAEMLAARSGNPGSRSTFKPLSSGPIVMMQIPGATGDHLSPQMELAAKAGLARLLEVGLVSAEQFEEMQGRLGGQHSPE